MFVISISQKIFLQYQNFAHLYIEKGSRKKDESFGISFGNEIILNFWLYTYSVNQHQPKHHRKKLKILTFWSLSQCFPVSNVTSCDTSMYTYCVNIRLFVWVRVCGPSFEKFQTFGPGEIGSNWWTAFKSELFIIILK